MRMQVKEQNKKMEKKEIEKRKHKISIFENE